MSSSPISLISNVASTQTQDKGYEIAQDFKQLGSALKSGNLSQAQQDYSALQQMLPNQGQGSQQSTASNNPILQDFQNLGQALQSGNLSSAQSSYSQLQTDMKAASSNGTSGAGSLIQALRGHHGHHHHAESTSDSANSNSSSSGSSGSSSTGQNVNVLA